MRNRDWYRLEWLRNNDDDFDETETRVRWCECAHTNYEHGDFGPCAYPECRCKGFRPFVRRDETYWRIFSENDKQQAKW